MQSRMVGLWWTAASLVQSWASLFTRRYSPQLLTSFIIQFFQQFTGINAIIFCECAISRTHVS